MEFNPLHLISMPTLLTCEVLIVGAGLGGVALAHELVQFGMDVLLIEEGPFIHDISQRCHYKNFSEVWRNGGLNIALGKPPIAYAEGCCVGGGSEINSGIFQYAPDFLLNDWATKYNIDEFSANILKPFYEVAERKVNADYLPFKLDSLLLERAAKKLGWQFEPLKVAHRDNVKQSMSNTLLPVALKKGLRLVAQCKATKLVFKHQRVVKVNAIATDHEGNHYPITIKPQYIFLCGGAICTPQLLLKSGIKKNVGKSLQMHPTLKALCLFKEPVSLDPSPVPSCAITEFMPTIRIGGSVMSPSFIGMSIAEDWSNRGKLLANMNYCGVYYAMIKPEGKGKIRYIPGYKKEVFISYKLTEKDWENLYKGLDFLQQSMFEAGADIVFPSVNHHPGWKKRTSLQAIKTLAGRQINLMAIHLFSSCPMGENKNLCAVNSFGKMHDHQNLYINDASIIPEAVGTNPQGTILALTLRNAEYFIHNIYRVGR